MGNLAHFRQAYARWGKFCYDNPAAKAYFTILTKQGINRTEALKQTRWHLAKEYYAWKLDKGYPVTDVDRQLLDSLKGPKAP